MTRVVIPLVVALVAFLAGAAVAGLPSTVPDDIRVDEIAVTPTTVAP